MTSRERLFTVFSGGIPDCVPVAPDTSNMIPCRLTGKPFWDIYLYQDPPQWKAYIDCVKHFGFDSLMDGFVPVLFDDLGEIDHEWTEAIVYRCDDYIVTQQYRKALQAIEWAPTVTRYNRDNPPNRDVDPAVIGLPATPSQWAPVEGRREWPQGEALFNLARQELGDHGLLGISCGASLLVHNEEEVYAYYDEPEVFYERRDTLLAQYKRRFERLMQMADKPDFIATGASGSLIFQTPAMFRELGLPVIKQMSALAKANGLFSHVHSCGPETALVRMVYEETDLTVVDPLERPPMGDCNLKELKARYGDRLVLKGNLHTTDIMLYGSVQDVVDASKRAIDDAAAGGRFILSTGDQCGRDTPDENLFAMIETARTYGRY